MKIEAFTWKRNKVGILKNQYHQLIHNNDNRQV